MRSPLSVFLVACTLLTIACVPVYQPQQGTYQGQQQGTYQGNPSANQPGSFAPSTGNNPISQLEVAVWQATNQQRQQYGLAPLQWNDRLSAVARDHSQDMLNRNYFSHTRPDGSGNFQIIERDFAGSWRNMGENIITSSGRPLNDINWMAQHLVTQWMNSPGHRENILTPNFTHLGVGFAMYGTELRGTQCFVELR